MVNWKRWYKVALLFILFHILYFGGQYFVLLPASQRSVSLGDLVQIGGVSAILLLFFGGYAWHIEHRVKIAPHYSLPVHLGHLVSSVTTGILLIMVLDAVVVALLQLLHIAPVTSQNQAGINELVQVSSTSKYVTIFLAVVIGPVCEETIYRLLLIGPKQVPGLHPAQKHRLYLAIFSWAAFIFAHMAEQIWAVILNPTWNGITAALSASLIYGCLSFVITREYYLHGSLARSIAVHMSWNALAASALFFS
ncbi:hypothetical protein LFYK43_02310 [Ligilactobacillus salitolerans]|uniref:CAAX prenyl protease 2/Lysostaphin resistance protein A-like domain-containing protein n=1 Tax=Ligilactobacillus salitolerans TaxID=1808352 RepID=A0A401IQG4_9LACO|nr:CPBP family glutamic-type intramembrane protease [Ligilactobacillus salitolerans]GBG93772.1 hypothetical protein LFYK43_02310 [Ligilactobacillus salitolerans]